MSKIIQASITSVARKKELKRFSGSEIRNLLSEILTG